MANRKLLKRMIPIFYSISVHVIKSNAARIDRQDDRKGLIAVDIDRLFGVAIINLKLLHQRQIVKDFLIKFTKKVPEAPYGS